MARSDYDLNEHHKVRYFPTDELEKVLKAIRKFVKSNGLVSIQGISMDSSFSYDEESGEGGIYWNAVVVYTGTVTEDNNVEA